MPERELPSKRWGHTLHAISDTEVGLPEPRTILRCRIGHVQSAALHKGVQLMARIEVGLGRASSDLVLA